MARVPSALVVALCLAGAAGTRSHADPEREPRRDVAPVVTRTPELGFVVSIAAIDPDSLTRIQYLLALEDFYPGPLDGRPSFDLDLALRKFAATRDLPSPPREWLVTARVIDALGAGRDVAVRWGGTGPRAPELTRAEVLRVNQALYARGYRTSLPTDVVDEDTIAAVRSFQLVTGHPVQRSPVFTRRWMFILGVASEEAPTTLPAGFPR